MERYSENLAVSFPERSKIHGFIRTSVVSVEVTPDLKFAKVYVSVLGDEMDRENTREGLASASSHIRSQLAKSLNLRNTPELHFVIDDSIEYGVNMSKRIDELTHHTSETEE